MKRRFAFAGAAGGLALTASLVFTPQAEAELVCSRCLMESVSQGLDILPDPSSDAEAQLRSDVKDTMITSGATADALQDRALDAVALDGAPAEAGSLAVPEVARLERMG